MVCDAEKHNDLGSLGSWERDAWAEGAISVALSEGLADALL